MIKILEEKFKFASEYFDRLIETKSKFPQSIVFEGLDIYGQYFFSLELARLLNCKNEGSKDCGCLNCSWIRENKHPQVITVSPVDFKPQGDESKTVISVKQTREIIKNLLQKSDYHRVFIFLDAKEARMDENSKNILRTYEEIGFKLPGENWIPAGLTRKVFDDEAPNSLLKSIEEPPVDTTFIFLTKNREDLINTIVSRSFVFRLPSGEFSVDYSGIRGLFSNYPDLSLKEALDISEKLNKYTTEEDILPSDVFSMIEEFLASYLRENPDSEKIKRDFLKVSECKKMIQASMKPKSVFDYLLTEFSL